MEKRVSLLHVSMIFVLYGLVLIFDHLHGRLEQNTQQFLNPPPEYMEYFAFGFNGSIADSLWLRWIQDGDSCQTYKQTQAEIPVHKDFGKFTSPRYKVCDNSWGFKMLDTVTKLDPKFKMPYEAGAVYLSVLVEDYAGAKVLFDRGVENYPDDWKILYRAAYHYLFDRQDFATAADLLVRAGKVGAPSWVQLLAAKLYSHTGSKQLGISTLQAFQRSLKDPKDIANVQKRIDELKAQPDDDVK